MGKVQGLEIQSHFVHKIWISKIPVIKKIIEKFTKERWNGTDLGNQSMRTLIGTAKQICF